MRFSQSLSTLRPCLRAGCASVDNRSFRRHLTYATARCEWPQAGATLPLPPGDPTGGRPHSPPPGHRTARPGRRRARPAPGPRSPPESRGSYRCGARCPPGHRSTRRRRPLCRGPRRRRSRRPTRPARRRRPPDRTALWPTGGVQPGSPGQVGVGGIPEDVAPRADEHGGFVGLDAQLAEEGLRRRVPLEVYPDGVGGCGPRTHAASGCRANAENPRS